MICFITATGLADINDEKSRYLRRCHLMLPIVFIVIRLM
jgi:hypothetical protein